MAGYKVTTFKTKFDYILNLVGLMVGFGNIWRFPYMCFKNGGGLGYSCIFMMIYWNSLLPVLLAWTVRWLYASFTADPINSSVTSFVNGNATYRSSVEEFFNNHILGKSSGLHEYGTIKLDLLICLAIVWIVAYFSVWKGIGWTSKVVYFTATTPFVMLLVLVIRGSTLNGAGHGVKEYLEPDAYKLVQPQVWVDAVSQVLFSFGVCTGGLSTMSMFNKDLVIMMVANATASFLAGIVCFTVLGHLALEKNTTVEEVAEKGPGLVFIVYPTAMSLLPLPNIWCALFFITMLLIGFDSLFVYHETFVCAIRDIIPQYFRFKYANEVWMAGTMFVLFLFGLTMITPGGLYILEILNNYGVAGWILFYIAVVEFVAIGWVYGSGNMCDMMQDMTGYNLGRIQRLFLHVMWRYVGPVIAMIFTLYSLSIYRVLKVDSYIYPTWANVFGWMTALSSALTFPIGAIFVLYKSQGITLKEKLLKSFKIKEMKRLSEVDREEKDAISESKCNEETKRLTEC